jgi:hypothetical protein
MQKPERKGGNVRPEFTPQSSAKIAAVDQSGAPEAIAKAIRRSITGDADHSGAEGPGDRRQGGAPTAVAIRYPRYAPQRATGPIPEAMLERKARARILAIQVSGKELTGALGSPANVENGEAMLDFVKILMEDARTVAPLTEARDHCAVHGKGRLKQTA